MRINVQNCECFAFLRLHCFQSRFFQLVSLIFFREHTWFIDITVCIVYVRPIKYLTFVWLEKCFFFFIWKKCAYDTGQNAKKRKLNSNSQLHIKKETKTQWNLHKSMALLSSLHRYFNIVQLITSFLYARVFYIIFIWNDFFCLFPMCCCLFEVWFSVYGHVHKYAYIFHTVRHVVRTHVHFF